MATSLILRAMHFAARAHEGQHRKGPKGSPKVPYIVHPMEVYMILEEMDPPNQLLGAAAFLHDVPEDCGVSLDYIALEFGADVAALVAEVTDPPDLHGKEAKAFQLVKAPLLSRYAKRLKAADRLSNLRGIYEEPPGWAQKSLQGYAEHSIKMMDLFETSSHEPLHNAVIPKVRHYANLIILRAEESLTSGGV